MIINKPLYSLQIYSGVMCTFAFVNFKFGDGSMMKIHILILGIFFALVSMLNYIIEMKNGN